MTADNEAPGRPTEMRAAKHEDTVPWIEATLIEGEHPLTKRYVIEDGKPKADGAPFLVTGIAHRLRFAEDTFAEEFSFILEQMHDHACIVLGALSDDLRDDQADITTKDRHKPREGGDGTPLIWRGKEWLGYREGRPGLLGLDHDAKDLPVDLRQRLADHGGLLKVLASVCPAVADSLRIYRPSVSTGIVADETGASSPGGGLHVYVPILDGSDAADCVERLHDRLLLAGWGYPTVTRAGTVLVRSLIDTAASGSGDRLWFEASALLADGLSHKPNARPVEIAAGTTLDTRTALPPLSPDEKGRVEQIARDLRASVDGDAQRVRAEHATRVQARAIERGEDAGSTSREVACLEDADRRGVLNGRHLLHLDDGRIVAVSDVISDPASYHRATCRDPLEPNYGGGKNMCILYTDGRHPKLYSHAHGSRLYRLAYDEQDLISLLGEAKENGTYSEKLLREMTVQASFSAGGLTQVRGALDAGRQLVTTADGGSVVPWSEPLDSDGAIDEMMREYNERFAVVAEGGSTSIYRMAYNADLGRKMPVSMTLESFKLLQGNDYVSVARETRNGEIEYQKRPKSTVWLGHPKRRTCPDGFGLDPTGRLPSKCYNLWQGYGVTPREGHWEKLAMLIFEVIANGDEALFVYVINWLAHLVQRPHENPGVALVLRGEEGVGKGTFASALMRMMRPHAMQITHGKHLTGAFNAHMRMVLFLFADEAFFAGDRTHEGVLKGLITEAYRVNEAKGRDATIGRNRMHLLMSSNNAWVVPASAEARRFAVLDVSSAHKQDSAYFSEIQREMDLDGEAGGIAAMLHDLLEVPIDMTMLRKAPETKGLHAQRIASLRGPHKWLFDVLWRGYVESTPGSDWQEHYSTAVLAQSYLDWAKDMKENYPASQHEIGALLSSMFDSYRPRIRTSSGTLRPPGYRLGHLTQARSKFAEAQQIGHPWPDDDFGDQK